jgi:N-acetylmuramic acid 6-phosphate etherase
VIAALDAAECESTFSAEPGHVVALVAGSELDSRAAQEAAEDDLQAGAEAIRALRVTAAHAVVGVSASGRTPCVVGAMAAAAAAGAVTAIDAETARDRLRETNDSIRRAVE